MGRRGETGRRRQDKFYHLAKETGYRARSAFKLIQLNRKFNFLEKARVCVDLCAAPGGWCQVAVKHMPISSLVIGVDLVPIKPIHKNVVCLQEDITTDKCRSAIRRELKTWKVDVVLHDGAPNVGAAWLQDAFTQSELTLSAMKLACDFLVPNGTFVTKVFRSKDYQALMDTFGKLFRKVNATKPQASRLESAEIFVVCQGYRAPKKVDPKLVDPKSVFMEENIEPAKPNLFNPEKKVPVEGYEEGLSTVYRECKVSQFITVKDHLEYLGGCSKLVFDSRIFSQHPLTTDDVKEYCEDIKVLGKRELRSLLKWRLAMRKVLEEIGKEEGATAEEEMDAEDKKPEELDSEAEEDKAVDEALAAVKAAARSKQKREHKDMMKQKKRFDKEVHLNMKHVGDTPTISDDLNLFSLRSIRSSSALDLFTGRNCIEDQPESSENFVPGDDGEAGESDDEAGAHDDDDSDDGDEWVDQTEQAQARELGNIHDADDDKTVAELAEEDDDGVDADELEWESDDDEENPLLVSMEDKENETSQTSRWFSDPAFDDVKSNVAVVETTVKKTEEKKESKKEKKKRKTEKSEKTEKAKKTEKAVKVEKAAKGKAVPEPKPEPVAVAAPAPAKSNPFARIDSKKKQLDAAHLALGSMIVASQKNRETIEDLAYNRYSFNDDGLPAWFTEDETRHMKRQMPITKEMVNEYKARIREINARPVKKIAEAKARKKRKAIRRVEKIKKQASAIDQQDTSSAEKAKELRRVYMKLGQKKKPKTTYVVAKKSGATKAAKRPDGVKGNYKVVDPRMKKDLNAMKRGKGKGGKGGKGGGKGGKGGKGGGKGGKGGGGKGKGRGKK